MISLAATQTDFLDRLRDDTALPQSSGEAVYRHAYRRRLIDALSVTYPRLYRWLGDDVFTSACLAYIARNPSRSWTLDHLGAGFDGFLAELYPGDPEIADLAWLDGALHMAFSGPDSPSFDPAVLAKANWATAGIRFVPTLAVGLIRTNAAAIWQALENEQTPPAVAVLPQPAALAVWRHGLEPKFRTIEAAEHDAILSLTGEMSFASLCAGLSPAGERDPAEVAGEWLAGWIGDGLIAAIG